MKHYKLAVLGATFYGVAAASVDKEHSIIIEESVVIGGEFINSFHKGVKRKFNLQTEQGRIFYNELLSRGAANLQGEIYPAPAGFVLSSVMNGVHSCFASKVISVTRQRRGYEVVFHNSNGFNAITADCVIDTTSEGVSKYPANIVKRSINVLVSSGAENVIDTVYNSLTEQRVATFDVAEGDSLQTAKEKIYDFFRGHSDIKILCVAPRFFYYYKQPQMEIGQGYFWAPSCAYDNLSEAFDNGIARHVLKGELS